MTPLTLGFMPLTDCVPLVVAKHKGFFERHALDVTLLKQNSWATLRDKLHADLIDAAQMLAPMPIASTLGLSTQATPVVTPFVLSRNGNAITLSKALFDSCVGAEQNLESCLPLPASALLPEIETRKKQGKKLTFATVFGHSCHFYQLKSWLEQYQIPIQAVNIVIVPPSHMVQAMQCGDIDGFCVGSPWNAHAVRAGIGITALTSVDIWPSMPEKVLGLKQRFLHEHPQTVHSLVKALHEACVWLSTVPNRFEAAKILCDEGYVGTSLDVLAPSLLGSCLTTLAHSPREVPHYNLFGAEVGALNNCPRPAQGEWILHQMRLAGHVNNVESAAEVVSQVFREDVYQCALLAQ